MSAYLASIKMCITAIQALVKALRNPASDDRIHAACALGKISEQIHDIVLALIQALGDVDEAVAQHAASSLSKIGNPAVPALIQASINQDPEVRFYATIGLADLEEPPHEAIAALIDALCDETCGIRWVAAETLEKIGTPEVLLALQTYKEHEGHRYQP